MKYGFSQHGRIPMSSQRGWPACRVTELDHMACTWRGDPQFKIGRMQPAYSDGTAAISKPAVCSRNSSGGAEFR